MKRQILAVNAAYFYRDPLPDAVRKVAAAGSSRIEFDGLPLVALSAAGRRELKTVLDGEGVDCVSVSTVTDLVPVNFGNLASLNRTDHNRAVGHLKRCLESAAELGAARLVCDAGTTSEDFVKNEVHDQAFFGSLLEVLPLAETQKVKVVLLNVPGRLWSIWDGIPPDKFRVVERHVWPWRPWREREEVVATFERRLSGRISWALDTANEMVAHGAHPFKLEEVAAFYLEHGLDVIYLANHPGPYNKVWHRLLLHQPLADGYYKPADYRKTMQFLSRKNFAGELILQIREKEPTENSLKRNLEFF